MPPEAMLDVGIAQNGDAAIRAILRQFLGRAGILTTSLVSVGQKMPLDTKVFTDFDERAQSALGEFHACHAFAIEFVAAEARQFAHQPEFGLALDEEPATRKTGPRASASQVIGVPPKFVGRKCAVRNAPLFHKSC